MVLSEVPLAAVMSAETTKPLCDTDPTVGAAVIGSSTDSETELVTCAKLLDVGVNLTL